MDESIQKQSNFGCGWGCFSSLHSLICPHRHLQENDLYEHWSKKIIFNSSRFLLYLPTSYKCLLCVYTGDYLFLSGRLHHEEKSVIVYCSTQMNYFSSTIFFYNSPDHISASWSKLSIYCTTWCSWQDNMLSRFFRIFENILLSKKVFDIHTAYKQVTLILWIRRTFSERAKSVVSSHRLWKTMIRYTAILSSHLVFFFMVAVEYFMVTLHRTTLILMPSLRYGKFWPDRFGSNKPPQSIPFLVFNVGRMVIGYHLKKEK